MYKFTWEQLTPCLPHTRDASISGTKSDTNWPSIPHRAWPRTLVLTQCDFCSVLTQCDFCSVFFFSFYVTTHTFIAIHKYVSIIEFKRQNPWGERFPCAHGLLSMASAARIWTINFAGPAPTFLPAQVFVA